MTYFNLTGIILITMEERLQKILAQAGLGSRRACEELILAGRVRVNGQVAIIGQKADPRTDKIMLDGNPIKLPEPHVYIALHKPRFVLSAVEAESTDSRKTVRDLVPVSERVYPVGRLDFDSEGLVLMTNDGDLAYRLTHPSHEHEKEYRVLVARHPDDEQLSTWRRGVVLDEGYKTRPAEVRVESDAGKGCWLRIIMHEGRKRQIREIGSLLGLPVVRIVRIRIGTLQLGRMKPGEWRYLSEEEVIALKGKPASRPVARPRMARSSPEQHARRTPGGERPAYKKGNTTNLRRGERAPRKPGEKSNSASRPTARKSNKR